MTTAHIILTNKAIKIQADELQHKSSYLEVLCKGKVVGMFKHFYVEYATIIESKDTNLEEFYNQLDIHYKSGKKLLAIKYVRECTHWTLKEAKEFVDNYYATGIKKSITFLD